MSIKQKWGKPNFNIFLNTFSTYILSLFHFLLQFAVVHRCTIFDAVHITSIYSFIRLPSFRPVEGHWRMNIGSLTSRHMIHSNGLALTLMPKQLNFPLSSRSEIQSIVLRT